MSAAKKTPARKKKARSKKPPPPTPAEFFERSVPRVLTAMASLCKSMGGVYAMVVEGDEGGAWTLDFGQAAVRPGTEGADLTVTLDLEQFQLLTTARGELRKLIAAGDARAEGGDPEKIENLSMVVAFLQRK